MNATRPPLNDAAVLQRTEAGQREALLDRHPLDDIQRRLLLLVNGYTPLGGLAHRLPQAGDVHAHVAPLIDRGLVTLVDD
ncbi:MAG: hypothetical protein ACTHL8_07200 [Burkholderiaceae bacterium]